MFRTLFATALLLAATAVASAQTPQPFPRPPTMPPAQPVRPPQPPPQEPEPTEPPQTPQPAPQIQADGAPTQAALGVPIYPNAQFLTSYDAGRGQRFYLFGVASTFAEMVNYYRTTLKQRGELLYESPATHMFEVARYRDDSMAFPPSVTIKDYASGGSPGYPNPAGGTMTHFPTVIQIVPAPTGSPQ